MGIEKKIKKLTLRVLACEENNLIAMNTAREAIDIAEKSILACDNFRKAVEQLTKTATHNAEAIVEHISQLDSEKEEVLNEFRMELGGQIEKFVKELNSLESKIAESKKVIGG